MTTNTLQSLRTQIGEIESKRVILEAERDDVSYSVLVERAPAALKRAAEIGTELAQLAHDEAMAYAALKTAIKREAEARTAEAASQKRADLAEAEALLPEVAQMALQIDQAMKTLHEATKAFEAAWSKIRDLSGAGPQRTSTNVHLSRSLRTGLRGLPGVQIDTVPPLERHTVTELAEGWSLQVRNMAETAKSKPKNTKAAIAGIGR
jgi:hypothetical protein